jgi:hypothetical protein
MRFFLKWTFQLALFISISACAMSGLYYLGLHGPSIRLTPEEHEGFYEDEECLECHGKESDPDYTRTTHSGFHGCLKCHNDAVATADLIKGPDLGDQNP